MKRENLMLVAGALLASTSITTAANAGTIFLSSVGTLTATNQATVNTTNFPVIRLGAQAFASATAATVSTGTVDLILRFASQLPVTFNGIITATNAQFSGSSSTALGVAFESTSGTIAGSLNLLANSAVCTSVLATGDKIFLQNCNGAQALSVGIATVTAAGVIVTGVSFKLLSGLATAGTSISLGAEIYLGTTQTTSIDSTTAAAKITSFNGITVQGGTSAAGTIDVAASKGAFTGLVTSNLSAVLGSVLFSVNAIKSLDLSTTIAAASMVAAGNEVKLTSAIFSDDATSQVRVTNTTLTNGTVSVALSAGYVTFQLGTASISGFAADITVDFNGTGQIDAASAGSTAVTFVTAGGNGVTTGLATAVPAQTLSSGLAAVSRNGLTVDLNGIYAGDYPVQYTSVVRVANTGTVAGTPTIQIYDESTGSLLGTATPTTSIPGGGSKQYTAKDLETLAGISATGFKTYRMTVSAGISGYVQQLLWNQTGGFFTDLSSRRTTKAGGL
ncbi:MAG: hypothetical protein JNM81_13360 [Rhodospirillaceae bacterium]|nr:hypothetical protein [Rhodospirillaceae bacterium]